jgi:hemolysin D
VLKNRTENLSDFLPAALEVRESAPHPASHYTAGTIITLLGLLFTWAYWGEIDIVARAEGKIIPLGQVRPVQSAEAGVVSEILVVEGEAVQRGEPLLRLSPQLIDTEIERATIEIERLRQLESRERKLLDFINLNEQSDLIPQTGDALLKRSFGAYRQRVMQMRRLIAERSAARDSAAQTLARLTALEPIVDEQVQALKKLQARKHASRIDYLEQRERLIDIQHQRRAAVLQQQQLQAEISARESELAAYMNEFKAEKYAAIEEFSSAIASQKQIQAQLHQRRSKLEIIAPISGRVKDLKVFSSDAVVSASEQLMTIVPLDGQLEVEAWLANRDIGYVEPGDLTEIKLETFPFTKYGVLHGEVLDLSADATQTDTGLIYKARIALNSREIEVDNRMVALMPGMGVTAEIRTGKRRVIDYVFDPLMRYRNESLRER